MIEKGNKKIIRGWIFYDWANSVYNLVISSAIFPIFYDNITTNYFREKYFTENFPGITEAEISTRELPSTVQVTVDFFGWDISNSALMSFVLSASFLLVAFLSPFLSGIADYLGNKKRFLQFFCYLGAFSCMSLYFFNPEKIEMGLLSVFLASIGFWNSLVFYNAYLPEIAEKKEQDSISAKGFSMGYVGGMLLLIMCLVLIKVFNVKAHWCFVLVGFWWLGFSQLTYRVLPNVKLSKQKEKGYIWKGFRELKHVFVEFRSTHRLKKYLLSFFFFNTGVQTVMLMATYYAKKEIDWPIDKITGKPDDSGLIIAILLIQILGIAGALLMAKLSSFIGNIKTLIIAVCIWIVVCCAGFIIHKPFEFYLLACSVGIVMGGVQALARSTYSKFLPETEDHASYFSFYDATEKIGIVMGTLFFGVFEIIFNSMRFSIVSVAFFFVMGLLFLFLVPKNEKQITEH